MYMEKIIVITGPTGVGKTKLSVSLAKKSNAEIINADSMYIYKEMNIEKTAKNNVIITVILVITLIINAINIIFLAR